MAESSPSERRLKQLEDEIRKIREPLEKTLVDIREMINSAENPFLFLTKHFEAEELFGQKKPSVEAERRGVAESSNKGPKTDPENSLVETLAKAFVESNSETRNRTVSSISHAQSIDSFISILAAVDLMVLIVGREYLTNLANMLAWKNLIPKSLLDGIKEALEFLSTLEKNNSVEQVRQPPGFNDILIVLYMMSLLVKDRENPLTFLLLTSAGNLKFLNRGWGGRQ